MKKLRDIIIFLDTDKHPSPFDLLMIADAFPEVQLFYYSQVEPEDAESLISDSMFARGPEGAKHTKIFVGGQDLEKAGKIVEVAKRTMFPPFEMSIIVDPKGANTTASALVAKVYEALEERGLGTFEGKNVLILAGTGPVGNVSARLMALEGADVSITSRSRERAESISRRLNEEIGKQKIRGIRVSTIEETIEAVKDADMILATGAAGVQLLPLEVLRNHAKHCRVVADVNAVKPYGIEGLKPSDDKVEVVPGMFGIGALVIGKLKNKVEIELIRRALSSPSGIFDHKAAYEIAKSLIS